MKKDKDKKKDKKEKQMNGQQESTDLEMNSQTEEVSETTELMETADKETAFVEKPEKVKKAQKERKPRIKWKDLPKDRRKKRIRKYILIGIAAVIVLFLIVSKITAANAKYPVMTSPVTTGNVEAVISTSGNVESDLTKTYYSELAGDIGSVAVKAGQAVEEGETLLSFGEESLLIAKTDAQAAALTSEGGYKDAMNQNAKTQGKLTEATVNLEVLEQQITDYKAFIKDQEIKLEDKKNARQAAIYGQQLELSEKANDGENVADEQAEVAYQQNMLSINKDLVDIQRTIDDAKETLTNLESYKSEMKSQKSATEDGVMSGTTGEAKKTSNELSQLQNRKIMDYAEQVSGGLKADFAGVVTKVTAVEGAPVLKGGELLTIASNKQVHVMVNLSKTDLADVKEGQIADVTIAGKTYEGEVTMINHMATPNSNNTPVVSAQISITNADSDIYLGVEAKVKIHAQNAEGVLIVPVEAVNSDKQGDFVYVVENGIVVRKDVVTGVSSDAYIEITQGLKENDQVMTDISTGITEGMEVMAMPQAAPDETQAAE